MCQVEQLLLFDVRRYWKVFFTNGYVGPFYGYESEVIEAIGVGYSNITGYEEMKMSTRRGAVYVSRSP